MKGVASVSNGTNGNYELNIFHVSASKGQFLHFN